MIGRIRVEKLTSGEIADAYTKLLASGGRKGKPLSVASVRLAASILHTALEDARKIRKLIRVNPAADASVPTARKRKPPRPFSAGEASKLIAKAGSAEAQDRFFSGIDVAVQLLMTSSIRRAELLALRWRDVDFAGSAININSTVVPGRKGEAVLREEVTKTEHSQREITIPSLIIALLRRHKAEQAEHALQWGKEYHRLDFIFPDVDGQPMRPARMTAHLSGLMKAAGVAKGKQPAHAWRHLSATTLLHAGEDLKTVSRRLGHSSPVTTLSVYSHTDKEKDAGASDTIGKALAGLTKLVDEAGN